MKCKASTLLLLILMVLTVVLPNNQFVTRAKASVTFAELDLSDSRVEETLPLFFHGSFKVSVQPPASDSGLISKVPFVNEEMGNNQSLNILYRSHSPPYNI